MIVLLALPDPRPSLRTTGDRRYAAQHGNDPTPLTDTDSLATTTPVKQASKRNGQRDRLSKFKYVNAYI